MKKSTAFYIIGVAATAVVGVGATIAVAKPSSGQEESFVQSTPPPEEDPSDEIADLEEPVVEGPAPSSTADFYRDAVGDPPSSERLQRQSDPTVGGTGWVADSTE